MKYSRCDVFLNKIESIDIDGKNRIVIQRLDDLSQPYNLAFYTGFLFWTEYNKGAVRRLNLSNGSVDTLIVENPPLFDMKVYDSSSQTTKGILITSNVCFI